MRNFPGLSPLFWICFSAAFYLVHISPSWGHGLDLSRPDAHAPISIMGDHTHRQGEWMASYRFMRMDMSGMRNGSESVASAEVFAANYTVTPLEMTMDMHMAGLMWAPSEQWTLMAMVNYLDISMDHQIFPMAAPLINLNGGSETFTTGSNGFGDTKVSALYTFPSKAGQQLHMGLGLSLPTGSIDEQDLIPGPGGRIPRVMPTPMQLGSGTFDFEPSLTYNRQYSLWSFGLQGRGVLRLEDENDRGYRRGHRFIVQSWVQRKLSDSWNVGAGLSYSWEGELKGAQDGVATNPPFAPSRRTVTTAFGENFGGEQIEALVGINFLVPEGPWAGHRLALDWRLPLHLDLNGYQLETDSTITVGWQKAW